MAASSPRMKKSRRGQPRRLREVQEALRGDGLFLGRLCGEREATPRTSSDHMVGTTRGSAAATSGTSEGPVTG